MTLDLILLTLAIALNPLPLSAYILVLGSRNGTRKGWGFLIGWVLCVAVVAVIGVLLTHGHPPKPNTAPSTAALVVRIAAGVALLAFAWRQQRRERGPRKEPHWKAKLDKLGFFAAAGVAVALQPWPMTAAAGATVTRADLTGPGTVVVLILVCALTSVGYLLMQVAAMLWPEATRVRLGGLSQWIDNHRDPLIVILSAAMGLWLIAKSSYLLV